MTKIIIYKASLVISFLLIITAAFFKIMHYQLNYPIFSFGVCISFIYIVLGVQDVYANRKLKPIEKQMWFTAFIAFSVIAGFIYMPKYSLNNKK